MPTTVLGSELIGKMNAIGTLDSASYGLLLFGIIKDDRKEITHFRYTKIFFNLYMFRHCHNVIFSRKRKKPLQILNIKT